MLIETSHWLLAIWNFIKEYRRAITISAASTFVGTLAGILLTLSKVRVSMIDAKTKKRQMLRDLATPKVSALPIITVVQAIGSIGFITIPFRNTNPYWKSRDVKAALQYQNYATGQIIHVPFAPWLRQSVVTDAGTLDGDAVAVWAATNGFENGWAAGIDKEFSVEVREFLQSNTGLATYIVPAGLWLLTVELITDDFIGKALYQMEITEDTAPTLKQLSPLGRWLLRIKISKDRLRKYLTPSRD